MFTQFFGNYLLNKGLVEPLELIKALEQQKTTRLKLGVLAINAGFLTAEKVDEIHKTQQRMDKRFGDIAIDLGYMTAAQVNELLGAQKLGHLLLGQTLVDNKVMTNSDFADALSNYKSDNLITDADFTDSQNSKMGSIISSFYKFNHLNYSDYYTEYVLLLFKNIIRFIGDDFTPLNTKMISQYKVSWAATQNITGPFSTFTAIDGDESAFIGFASRYAEEKFKTNDEFVQASIGEFLNLHNGLFTVNMSNDRQMELEMLPQNVINNVTIKTDDQAFCVPICFPFGTINFILSTKNPIIE
ncbi:MAG: chemotaxis protein CheX [Oscillospiraceae bacterium]